MTVTTMPKTDKDAATPRGKKKLITIALVAVMVVSGATWFLFLKPGLAAGKPPEPGQVLGLQSIRSTSQTGIT